ncbi:MAG: hypothetical protein H0W02_03110 [Ktedonobacteraceae bacterium]|nr:hypothetical protein [Ktedonobacteraceae bacterium]
MNDKTFSQAMDELQQKALTEITNEALRCWRDLQRNGATISQAIAHIESTQRREIVMHIMFYMVLHSLLFDAQRKNLIGSSRYTELKTYIDTLAAHVRQDLFMTLDIS